MDGGFISMGIFLSHTLPLKFQLFYKWIAVEIQIKRLMVFETFQGDIFKLSDKFVHPIMDQLIESHS